MKSAWATLHALSRKLVAERFIFSNGIRHMARLLQMMSFSMSGHAAFGFDAQHASAIALPARLFALMCQSHQPPSRALGGGWWCVYVRVCVRARALARYHIPTSIIAAFSSS